MFLFAVGYRVGPQFFRGLRKDGLPVLAVCVVLVAACLLSVLLAARIAGLNPGQAAGLLAGACTISAVIGVSTDTINSLPLAPDVKAASLNAMPVAYAVTYLYGTAGSAWFLATIGPKLLRVNLAEECAKYESESGAEDPASAALPMSARFTARAYQVTNPRWVGRTIAEFERQHADRRLFVLRVRDENGILEAQPDHELSTGAVVALIGRREHLLKQGSDLGPEVEDSEVLDSPAEVLDVVITNRAVAGQSLLDLTRTDDGRMSRGVFLRKLVREGRELPFVGGTVVDRGDVLQIAGPAREVDRVAAWLGYADRATEKTDIVFLGLGIVLGGLAGTLTLRLGSVPLSLSTSGGVLIAGLICGWLRSVNRTFGRIPAPALWVFSNLGLNMFIAVVGISSGPTFIAGVRESGLELLLCGVLVTTLPFIVALLFGKYVMKLHPAILLGACAGGRASTAALGALEDAARSRVPALGYTVPYAVGNVLMITGGVVMVLVRH